MERFIKNRYKLLPCSQLIPMFTAQEVQEKQARKNEA